ncbi:GNAT family N-acetyltransferase [Micromonospora sp. NPDC050417]|uniref:GNAT family N-acetyltransferase n=1 Tax=Micromonospora sp. NPDC050417 TaxID=3364280 RepID=UPI0037BB2201
MSSNVRLTPIDERTLEPLLSVAAAEAEPDDVMPPVDAPAGWSHARREAFREFHRARFDGLTGATRTAMFAIMVGDDVVGMIRMTCDGQPTTMETGMWLGKSARGQGIAATALRLLLAEAVGAGARLVTAETTVDNTPALSVLRRAGAELKRDGDVVRAQIRLG